MANPTLTDYISLDSLLEGYSKEPLVSIRYEVTCHEDRNRVTDEILSKLSPLLKLDESALYLVEMLIGEGVQNISTHCCGESDVKVYMSQDLQGFIASFELNDEAQFGKPGHQQYQRIVSIAHQKSLSSDYGKMLLDISNCVGPENLEDFYLGTMFIAHYPEIRRMGIADIGGRAYFFFEYKLS